VNKLQFLLVYRSYDYDTVSLILGQGLWEISVDLFNMLGSNPKIEILRKVIKLAKKFFC
jgi:hypothetical protein